MIYEVVSFLIFLNRLQSFNVFICQYIPEYCTKYTKAFKYNNSFIA